VIDRRTFLAGTGAVLLAAPLAAEAQPVGKVPVIGVLEGSAPALNQPVREAFRRGLEQLGWVEVELPRLSQVVPAPVAVIDHG
jgi:hypothetical protein